MNNTRLVSAWKKARSLQNSTDSLRQDLTKDPLRIPEMPLAQYNDLRAKFLESHMDAVMLEHREPNKRFGERVARDLLVHDVVLPYHLHEVRLRSETIQQRPGFSASAEKLLQVSQEDLPGTVNSEDDALNRIHALYTTCEYVGVLAFSKSQVLSGKHVGGALDFIQALEMKRQETPGLHFIVQADYRIRKKVHKLMTEDRHLFATFAVALHHTLLHERNIWSEFRMEILHGSQRAANRVATAGGEPPEKKGRAARRNINKKDGSNSPQDGSKSESSKNQQIKRRKEELDALKSQQKKAQQGSHQRSRTPPKKKGSDTNSRVPANEW